MNYSSRLSILLAMAASIQMALVPIAPSLASVGDSGEEAVTSPAGSAIDLVVPAEEPVILLAFSDSTTNAIVNRLNGASSECGSLPAEYRVDCLSQGYRSAAGATEGRPDYSTAQSQLSSTSRQLASLVSQNEDKAAAPLKKGGKTFRAVKKSAVAAVNKKAKSVIAETETKLLRSAGAGLAKTHYTRIAQAVGSTKNILRS